MIESISPVKFSTNNQNVHSLSDKAQEQGLNQIEQLKRLYFKCEFNSLIRQVDEVIQNKVSTEVFLKAMLLKSKALYELNRITEAKQALANACPESVEFFQSDLVYVKANLAYFDGEFDLAKTYFKQLLDKSDDKINQFKALIGLGNVFYSNGQHKMSLEYAREIKALKADLSKEYDLSYKLFLGTVYMYNNLNITYAKECFEDVYQQAYENQMKFFAQRALYNLAKWHKKHGEINEAKGILNILDLQTRTSDSRFLSYLINKEFDSIAHKSTLKIELDKESYQVIVGNKDKESVCFQRWPLLFKFLTILFDKKDFVSKDRLAMQLWPDQNYKPKTHDPRIYDIVARVKKQLDFFETRPLALESGPKGYKLNIR